MCSRPAGVNEAVRPASARVAATEPMSSRSQASSTSSSTRSGFATTAAVAARTRELAQAFPLYKEGSRAMF